MVRPLVARQRERRQDRRADRKGGTKLAPSILNPKNPLYKQTLRGIGAGDGQADPLTNSARDPDLVGSGGTIEDFDGSTTEFGGSQFVGGGAGGGGTGSALFGRESSGQVGDTQGQSLDEVVYGAQRKSRRVRRPRGE